MKTKSLKSIMGAMAVTSAVAVLTFVSCTKEKIVEKTVTVTETNTVTIFPDFADATNSGTDVIDARVGQFIPTTWASDSGAWKVDKSHNSLMWETRYYANNAGLTGRFNQFDVKVKFDEANPANTSIKAWVQLSTYNTGEPGRDAFGDGSSTFWNATAAKDNVRFDTTLNTVTTNTLVPTSQFWHIGCGMGYMGVKFDTAKTSTGKIKLPLPKFTPKASTDSAFFVSTSCKKESNYYIVTGDFTFRGITKSVDMKMGYFGRHTATATTGKAYKTDRAGLYGEFMINANTVFGVNSTSINDEVKIRVNVNCVTAKYTGTNKY